jgi:tripartite-type tricarboxylate transporter receptor subunit TctC
MTFAKEATMIDPFRRRAGAMLAACAFALGSASSSAQDPKPVRVILPVSAGSGVDTIVRALVPSVSKALGGQALVVENLPGAGGITGTQAIVKAAPDGQTIGVVSNNHVINPSVFKSMPYDALSDVTPISVIGGTPFVIVVNPQKLPVHNVKEMIALLKAKPGEYNFASSGNGTVLHLAAEMFNEQAGVQGKHIPYKGVGPMLNDLLGGQVDWCVTSVPSVQGHLKAGTLRAIGVGSAARIPQLPDVPTVVEQGLPNYLIEGWFAVVGPAKLPATEVKRINDAFRAAVAMPEAKEAMAKQGNVINPTTPEEAAAFFKRELDRFAALVKKANVRIE